eukprot:gnl/TRDRNA2_/TRDRNA2_158210_c2_seq1.p2 gnl/TRDRNA2_/TRDRNA2_158210_c2~~gnl/TRDRNA2_/TRDRNA2_158210_c2_seq1.p2  ORF type:complete len:113 (-),score=33.05 gnl/TRDRNA2_/TRDRNA2_158210_c2_seq1:102-440(-)
MSRSGVVKFFNDEKGFGFITPNDGSGDIFVHRTQVQGGTPQEGDNVFYDAGTDDRTGKSKAFNVTGGTGPEGGSFGGGKGGGKPSGGKGGGKSSGGKGKGKGKQGKIFLVDL